MKIDTDLRLTIRSAEKAQPSDDWSVRQKREEEAIAAFMSSHPSKSRKIKALIKEEDEAEKRAQKARESLCELFGLRSNDQNILSFSRCDNNQAAFIKAGGKIPTAGKRWKYDEVIAELAKAEGKQATAILKKYGLNWK